MKWYYADAGKQVGPIEDSILHGLVASGQVRDDTLVWHEGMESWQPLRAVREFVTTVAAPIAPPIAPPVAPVRYAGFWIRFVARVIDAALLGVVNAVIRIPLAVMLGLGTGRGRDLIFLPVVMSLIGISVAISIAVGVVYEVYLVSTRGGTLGKLILGLKIVRADGSPVPAGLAAGRYFAQWLSGAILMIGYIMAGFDPEKRALHDRICETRVVYAR
jgi:uncharacterized RDD family membrane protein YckC